MTLSKFQPLFAVLLLLFFVGMSIYGVAEESIDVASHTLVSCVLVAGTNCSQACHVVDDDPYIFPTKKRWSSSHTVCKYAFVANVSYTFADVPYTAINVPVYDWYDTGPIRISDPGNCTVENGTATTTIGRAWIAKDLPESVVEVYEPEYTQTYWALGLSVTALACAVFCVCVLLCSFIDSVIRKRSSYTSM